MGPWEENGDIWVEVHKLNPQIPLNILDFRSGPFLCVKVNIPHLPDNDAEISAMKDNKLLQPI